MKILIAPNSFKESASSIELAALISAELQKKNLSDFIISPVSDGGDNFLDVYKLNYTCKSLSFQIQNCYNNLPLTVPAAYDPQISAFILESAQIIGLKKIPPDYRNPIKLNSQNLGMLFSDLINNYKAENVLIGLGGTGTTDLGLGLCKSFGLKLFDNNNSELEVIPENYLKVNKILLPGKTELKIEAVSDVLVPLYGKHGSAFIFAGQKGASEEDIGLIDEGFRNIIKVLKRDHKLDFTKKNLGAAGGLTLGLSLIGHVKITSSRKFIRQSLGINKKIKACDLVITAEGRFDKQSFLNKATGVIVNESLKRNKKIVIITGESTITFGEYDHPPLVFELVKLLGSKEKALREYKEGITISINKLYDSIQMKHILY